MSKISNNKDIDHEKNKYKISEKDNLENKNNIGNCLADFIIMSEIGRGSYGIVYKV